MFDGPSRIIDLGHARSFTGAARRAVEIIDRHCQGPGCHTPAHQCQIDHRWRHHDGGPTHPDNGQAACGYHNRHREQPKPRSPGRSVPDLAPEQRAAHLDAAHARIRDQILHDPRLGWSTDPDP
ncbi:MAG: HNH endonuclease signature motif containing protein [Acidimicrobiales bacterium]